MKTPACALIALALALSACVENEEDITVRSDGSVAVVIKAKGKPADLADGYPLPLVAPWIAENEATLEWMRVLGADTGSAAVRTNLAALGATADRTSKIILPDEELALQVRADFPSVKALPRWLAPESEPFRTAYLERTADLRVERKGSRTVYVFERVYRARTFERLDILSAVKGDLDKELFAKIESEGRLTDGERAKVADAAVDGMRRVAGAFAGDALLSLYTQGDASLSPQAAEWVLASVREAIAQVVTRTKLDRIVEGVFPPEGQSKAEDVDEDLERLEKEVRETLRAAFARALAQELDVEQTPAATINALRGELEWLFTARDHTDDLGDETFELRLRLPGTIVGGNYDELREGAASWKFEGQTLRDRDRVLRAVSVVE